MEELRLQLVELIELSDEIGKSAREQLQGWDREYLDIEVYRIMTAATRLLEMLGAVQERER